MYVHKLAAAIAAVTLSVSAASAQTVSITVENLADPGGVSLTPVFAGLHDGSFDLFDPGGQASPGLEAVAELGATATLAAEFDAAQPAGVSATLFDVSGPPVFSPGEAATSFTLDTAGNRFFSFAGMVVPSNDLFVGNPEAIELFDADGNFVGPTSITLTGANVWDAGTEVNDVTDGPAFVAGADATAGTAENGDISLLFDDADAAAYLDSLIGLQTPAGEISSVFDGSSELYRISFVEVIPEPTSLAGLGLAGLLLRRRR